MNISFQSATLTITILGVRGDTILKILITIYIQHLKNERFLGGFEIVAVIIEAKHHSFLCDKNALSDHSTLHKHK